MFSNLTGIEVASAWTILGLSAVLGSIAVIGFVAWRISGRPWAPLVLGILLWIGPLASVLFDNWFVSLSSHAVLWGPYAGLYPLNAEAVGLSVGSAALALGYWAYSRANWSRNVRLSLLALSVFVLGLVANFQTYSFLSLTAITLWVIAIAGLLRAKSRSYLILTISLLVLVLLVAPLIQGAIGALPVYVLMLATTVPGIWSLAKSQLHLALMGLFFFALGASPQIIWIISGTVSRDPFLLYRVDSSVDLGVPIWAFLLLGSPILLTWMALLRVHIKRRGHREIALLVGWFIAFVLLSFNDLWGFNQEPYRFWINSVIVFVAIAALTLPAAPLSEYFADKPSRLLSTLAFILVSVSLWNVGGFRAYVSEQGNIDFSSPQYLAIGQLVDTHVAGPGLLSAEPCIDPRQLKVATGSPVAFYNLGLAWPDRKSEIDAVLASGAEGILNTQLMREAGVTYLITDSTCETNWNPGVDTGVSQISVAEYPTDSGTGQVSLWRIDS